MLVYASVLLLIIFFHCHFYLKWRLDTDVALVGVLFP